MGRDQDETATDGETKRSTFLVTHADEDSAVLKDVTDGQVHTLESNPGVTRWEAIECVIGTVPPLEATWTFETIEQRRELTLEVSDEPPTKHERDIAESQPVGELTREERAGTGELHVITVTEDDTDEAVEDVLGDPETTLARAARLGVNRVEIRSEPGVVSVRYLP